MAMPPVGSGGIASISIWFLISAGNRVLGHPVTKDENRYTVSHMREWQRKFLILGEFETFRLVVG